MQDRRRLHSFDVFAGVGVDFDLFAFAHKRWHLYVRPVSVLAGLNDPVAVAPFRLGSVSVIVRTTLGGSCRPIGRSLWKFTITGVFGSRYST